MKCLLAWLLLVMLSHPNVGTAAPLVLNTAHFPPRSTLANTGFEDLLVKELFRRANLSLTITHLPSERCMVNVNEGIDAGNYARVAGLEKKYPNLVMVPEPLAEFEFAVFSRSNSLRVKDWSAAKNYTVGIITGWKILEDNLQGAKNLVKVKDHNALFELLQVGRVDLVVFDRLEGEAAIREKQLQGIVVQKELLARRDMFLYLNTTYTPLVATLARHLKEMKQDGTYRSITAAVIGTSR